MDIAQQGHPKLNVALVGFGYAGRVIHAPLLAASDHFKLRAIVSRNAALVQQHYPGMTVVSDLASLLASGGTDVVVVATPNDTHYPLAKAALNAGCHVVVDKPFALSTMEARDLANIAQQRGKILSIFHNRRWDADFLTLRSVLAEGLAGTPVFLESRFDRFRPQPRDRWRERPGPGAGILMDLGPHLIDQAVQLFGMPQHLFADIAVQRPGARVDDYFHLTLRYENNLRVILAAGMLAAAETARFHLQGSAGAWRKFGMDSQEAALVAGMRPRTPGWGVDQRAGTLWRLEGSELRPSDVPNRVGDYGIFYDLLFAALCGKGANPVTPQEGIMVMTLIEAARLSAQTGAIVPIPTGADSTEF